LNGRVHPDHPVNPAMPVTIVDQRVPVVTSVRKKEVKVALPQLHLLREQLMLRFYYQSSFFTKLALFTALVDLSLINTHPSSLDFIARHTMFLNNLYK
jgi:hypothetical protein